MEQQAPADHFEAANQIFCDALELPPEDRASYVRSRCESDTELAATVLTMLRHFDSLGSFLETPLLQAPPRTAELRLNELLCQRFRITGLLGSGGMGEVYRADDLTLGEPVALKIVRARWRSDATMLARFRDEIRLARRVSHRAVCHIFDLFTHDANGGEPLVFFTMELLSGDTLARRLSACPGLGTAEVLRIASAIADGMDAAHHVGVVHRDLKPGNIMLVPESSGGERVVITDFGLARAFEREGEDAGLTMAGQIVGSPDYMAPEQFAGLPATPATDVFALALIIYEMASGRRPWPAHNVPQALVARLTTAPARLSTVASGAPRHWDGVLARALSREPPARPQSAGELVRALSRTPLFRAPRITRRRMLLAGAAAAPVAVSLVWLRFMNRSVPEAPVVMLTPVSSSSSDPQTALSAKAADVLLARELAQSAHVGVVAKQDIASAWRHATENRAAPSLPQTLQPKLAREIALRTGASFICFENYALVGDERHLEVRLELLGDSPERAQQAWSRDISFRTDSDLPDAITEVSSWIRRAAGESQSDVESRSRPAEDLTTSSWEALREFTSADEAWTRNQADAAELHLRTAITLDQDFALAHARLADILMALSRPDDAYQEWGRAAQILRQRNLTDRESLLIRGLFALDAGDNEEAAQVFSRNLLEYPGDARARFYKAGAVSRLGRREEALELLNAAIARAPTKYSFVMGRAIHYLEDGRLDDAERDWNRGRRLDPSDWTDQIGMAIAFARSDFKGVRDAIERMRTAGSPEFQSKSYALEACFGAERGQWKEVERILLMGIDFDRRTGRPLSAQATKQRLLAEAYLKVNDPERALQVCDDLLAAAPGLEMRMQAASEQVRARPTQSARWQLCLHGGRFAVSQPCSDSVPSLPVYQYWRRRLDAEIAIATGNSRRALVPAAPPASSTVHIWPEHLLRAALAARDAGTAAELFSMLDRSPGRWWLEAEKNALGFVSWAADNVQSPQNSSHISGIVNTLRSWRG
jgi:serine/threonine protein kinase/tetratricopeptide (TPR) repeat protein